MIFEAKQTHLLVIASLLTIQATSLLAQPDSAIAIDSQTPVLEVADAPESMHRLTWPLLPGENLNRLATLFYPNNKSMQKRFVDAALLLSRDLHPSLTAQTAYNQTTMVVIPDLKTLTQQYPKTAVKKPSKLTMSYSLASSALEEVTPAMQAKYEYLTQRNEKMEQELARLSERQANLQAQLAALKKAAQLWLEQEAQQQAAQLEKNAAAPLVPPTATFVEKPQVNSGSQLAQTSVQPPVANNRVAPALEKSIVPTQSFPQVKEFAEPEQAESSWLANLMDFKLWLALALFAGLSIAIFARRRSKLVLNDLMEEEIQPLNWDLQTAPLGENTRPPEARFEAEPISIEQATIAYDEMQFAVEKAEKLMGEHKPNQAIQLLLSTINAQPKLALHPWLYLLDIYRTLDKKADFVDLAKRFHQSFNVMVPQWEAVSVNLVVASSLEEFPHVIEHLIEVWNTEEASPYIDNLIVDNRDGERAGFSIGVLQELLMLKEMLEINSEAKLPETEKSVAESSV